MSKYKKKVLEILSKEKLKSTNEVLHDLQKLAGKTINWHSLYRILMELKTENKVERLETKAGFFWRKRK